MQISIAKAHKLVRELTSHINSEMSNLGQLKTRQVKLLADNIPTISQLCDDRRNDLKEAVKVLSSLNRVLYNLRSKISVKNAELQVVNINGLLNDKAFLEREERTLTTLLGISGSSTIKNFDNFKSNSDISAEFQRNVTQVESGIRQSLYSSPSDVYNIPLIDPEYAQELQKQLTEIRKKVRDLDEEVTKLNLNNSIVIDADSVDLLVAANLL